MAKGGPLNLRGTIRINASQAVGALGRVRGGLAAVGRMTGVKAIGGAFRGAASAVGAFGSQLSGLVGPMAGLAGLGLGIGIVAAVEHFAKTADEAMKLGRVLGTTAQFVREFEYVSNRQGAAAKNVSSSFGTLNKRVGELKVGTGGLYAFLNKEGSEWIEQFENARSFEEQLLLTSDAYEQFEKNGGKGMAFLSAAFSRGGAKDMIKVFQGGRDAIRDLRKEGAFLLGTIGDASAQKIEAYNDSVTNVQAAIRGVGDAIGSKVLPVMTPMLNKFAKWIASNRELISTKVAAWVENTAKSIQNFDWAGFWQGAERTVDAMRQFVESVGGVENVLIGFGAMLAGPFIASFAAAGYYIIKLGALLAASPIGWMLAAIGVAVYGLRDNFDDLKAAGTRVWDGLAQSASGFLRFAQGAFSGDLADALSGIRDIWEGAKGAWQGAFAVLTELARGFVMGIDSLFGTNLLASAENAFDRLSGAWGAAMDALKAKLNSWVEWFKSSWVGQIMTAIDSAVGALGRLSGVSAPSVSMPSVGGGGGGGGAPQAAPGPPGTVASPGAPQKSSSLIGRSLGAGGAGGGPAGGAERKHASLDIRVTGGQATAKFSDKSGAGSPMFDQVNVNTGPSMRGSTATG